VESIDSVDLDAPAVPASDEGAATLGRLYWDEVRLATRCLVRLRARPGSIELCVLGRGPALLRLEPARLSSSGGSVTCSYEILGGALARRHGGFLRLSQIDRVVAVEVTGYAPRLLPRRSAGIAMHLYRLQERAHTAVSRRYLHRLRSRRVA
jgi:hypothetical protein